MVRETHTENHTEGSKSDHRSMEQKRRKLSVTKIYLTELQRYLLKLPLLYPFAMTKLLVRELSWHATVHRERICQNQSSCH